MNKPESKKVDLFKWYEELVKTHPLPISDKPRDPDHEYLD